MSRSKLVPDAPITESDTTVSEDATPEEESTAVNEANEAVVAEDNAAHSIPDKYQGKSLEDVVAMHINAEKEIGRQANEVGTYRDLLKSLSDARGRSEDAQTDTTDNPEVEVSSDDLWDNPTEAIRSVVRDALGKELAPLQQSQQQQQIESQVTSLMQEHPDAETIGASPEFQAFVEKSPYRLQDAQRWVENRDVDAARRLLSDWKELKGTASEEAAPVVDSDEGAVRAARAVSTESGRGSGGPKGQDTLSKREVMKVFINDRELYDSDAFQSKLLAHARRGTLVD